MQQLIYIAAISLLFVLAYLFKGYLSKKEQINHRLTKFSESVYDFTVYRIQKDNNQREIILEGNKIDELGYQIYKSHIADLDKIDILIRDNQTGEIMKIVKDSDNDSMIGVSHPEKGHIGYLQFENLNSGIFINI